MSLGENISSAVNQIRRHLDPVYVSQYREEKEACRRVGMVSLASIVGSVALDILGFSLATCGGIAAVIGASLLLASLPIGYLAYNCYTLSKNVLEIVNNPSAYRILGLGPADRQRIRSKLGEGTFLCNWAVDIVMHDIVAAN
jgi:hypothetical protein